jgi:hypothetical protein
MRESEHDAYHFLAPERLLTNRREDAYDDAYWGAMEGRDCSFWPTNNWRTSLDYPEYDNEQYIPVFVAVKLAASLINASDEDKWVVVETALRAEAEKYAQYMRDKA